MKTVELFRVNPEVLDYYQERFRYIMVDEYQDTNTAQFRLIELLSAKYKNLCVVGDDDQSIYKFRGANIENILEFESAFPGAKVIRLEQNYLAVRFSRCCSPVPGDEIVGFVTRGRGISIHRTDCINIINLPKEERSRLIDAEWQLPDGDRTQETYSAEIKIYARNRMGLAVDISKVFTERQIDITSMMIRTSKQGMATVTMSFDTHGVDELSKLIEKLRQIDNVIDIERTAG